MLIGVSGHLHMRPIQWHLKNHWHVPEVLEKEIPLPRSLYPHLQWWLDEDNVLRGQPLHLLQHALQLFTDASNEGWGPHLGDHTAKGVWSDSESQLHINFLELKAVLLALKKFEQQCWGQIILIATDNTTVVSYINKEGGMRSVCFSSTRSAGMKGRCSQPELGEYGCLGVPSCISSGQGGLKDPRSGNSQVGPHCSRVAQHALVLGPGQHVCSGSSLPSTSGEPVDPTVQSIPTQRSLGAQPTRLAPRARAIYESKWAIFVKWCELYKVDFRSPSVNQVAEFLLFLFKEKNLQPSNIDGYRTAKTDKIGSDKVNFGKDENLTRLLHSFHRDKPKGLLGVPSWNLSLVLHQLTQPPFEPL